MKRLALISALVALTAVAMNTVRADSPEGHRIEGAWTATWTFTRSSLPFVPVGSGFSALHAFHRGGALTSVDDDFFDSTGVGAWTETGERKYRFAFDFFVADDQSPATRPRSSDMSSERFATTRRWIAGAARFNRRSAIGLAMSLGSLPGQSSRTGSR